MIEKMNNKFDNEINLEVILNSMKIENINKYKKKIHYKYPKSYLKNLNSNNYNSIILSDLYKLNNDDLNFLKIYLYQKIKSTNKSKFMVKNISSNNKNILKLSKFSLLAYL